MKWKISRTNEPGLGELDSVVVCAEDESTALGLVCGGPSRDYPGVSFLDTPPLPGFPADRTRVTVEEMP